MNCIFQLFPELSLIFLALLHKYNKNAKYGNIVSSVLLIITLGVLLKKIMKNFSDYLPRYVLYRPRGAFACNGSDKSNCDHEIGMPSIHSMIAGYYAKKFNHIAFIIFALSRLGKSENPLFYHSESGCHTLPQIIIGFVIGYIIGFKI